MTIDMRWLREVKVGDVVTCNLGGVTTELKVTEVWPNMIVCGAWMFDRNTGWEEDEYLGRGVDYGHSGSRLTGKVQ